jgi:hypothetical protein
MAMDDKADSHASMGITPITTPASTAPPQTVSATPPANTFGATSAMGASGFGSGFGSGMGAAGASGTGQFGGGMPSMGMSSPGGFGGMSSPGSFGSMPNMSPPGMTQPGTGSAMQEGGVAAIQTDKGFSDFINKRWRPLMAVIYMVTCTTDFVVFPILWSILQATYHGTVTSQWAPLTLQGAGLYHIAMGAVLGLAAYGRSQEKIAGKA